jgi:hypothetical protein
MAHALVNGLRARGIDVLTVGEVARKRLEDAEQLEFATSQGRVLYTFNTSDFLPATYRMVDSGQGSLWDCFCGAATLRHW